MHRWAFLVVAALLGASLVVAAPAQAAGGRYVALGDSYAAGLGLSPADTSATGKACGRSTSNYPHQLASQLGLTLVDVTCSGAVIADLAGSQRVGSTTVPPQFDALTTDTRYVTLTIGGNDLGFGAIAAYCASLSGPDGPVNGDGQASDCTSHFDPDGRDTLAAKLDDVIAPALAKALATIEQRAPGARVQVLDYPAIVPDAAHTPAGGCWTSPLQQSDALPFTTADLPYLQQIEARLNNTLVLAAGNAGMSLSSSYTDSLAHTACSSSPWVNGVQLAGLSVAPRSLHPNADGVTEMVTQALSIARPALAGDPVPATHTIPLLGTETSVPTWVWVLIAVGVVLVIVIGLGGYRVARRRR